MKKIGMFFVMLLLLSSSVMATQCFFESRTTIGLEKISLYEKDRVMITPLWDLSISKKILRFHTITGVRDTESGLVFELEPERSIDISAYARQTEMIQNNCDVKEYKRIYGYSSNSDRATTEEVVEGDIDGDGKVTSEDVDRVKEMISDEEYSEQADLDGDGVISSGDLSKLKELAWK